MDLIHQDSLETKSRISTITLFGKNLWCNRQGCSSQILSQLENLFVIQLIPISYSIRQHRERHVLRLSSMGTHSGCPRRGWLTFSEWMCELSEEATIRKIGIVQSEGDSAWSIFLSMNYYKAIVSTGTVSQEEARDKAYSEYDKFNNNACNAASEP